MGQNRYDSLVYESGYSRFDVRIVYSFRNNVHVNGLSLAFRKFHLQTKFLRFSGRLVFQYLLYYLYKHGQVLPNILPKFLSQSQNLQNSKASDDINLAEFRNIGYSVFVL
ncbi:ORF-148 [Teiidae poxvirus 1]|nr:ORF-148 [Teiidae poxvirus 1]